MVLSQPLESCGAGSEAPRPQELCVCVWGGGGLEGEWAPGFPPMLAGVGVLGKWVARERYRCGDRLAPGQKGTGPEGSTQPPRSFVLGQSSPRNFWDRKTPTGHKRSLRGQGQGPYRRRNRTGFFHLLRENQR